MQQTYSIDQLNMIAKENYSILRGYCDILNREGYWDGPEAVLKQTIHETLDFYVQSILIRLAEYCGRLQEEERKMIAGLPQKNAIHLSIYGENDEQVLEDSFRVYQSPPILIQIFGLRDTKKHSGLTGLFFDALLNIQLAMAHLRQTKMTMVTKFMREYFHKVEAFLYNQEKYAAVIDEKFIFLKICNGILEHSHEHLREAGEDFESYKKKYLYLKRADKEEDFCGKPADLPVESKEAKPAACGANQIETNQTAVILDEISTPKHEPAERSQLIKTKEKEELDRLLEELNSLVGLKEVKEEICSLINLIKVKKMRESHNLPMMEMSFHMVFTGSPGTGKTTVARLVSAIYKELGLLSNGKLVETDRSGLVAGYVGQTALKVKEIVEKSVGGILFIDEAYSLSSGIGSNDFGEEAIDTLVKLMEDHRDDLVVIVAGYTKEMQRFLKSNTGLVSRFNKFIMFQDYTDEELVKILYVMAEKSGFHFDQEAKTAVEELISTMTAEEQKEFGNARGIRNLFERLVVNQANRVVSYDSPTKDQLSVITKEDVLGKVG